MDDSDCCAHSEEGSSLVVKTSVLFSLWTFPFGFGIPRSMQLVANEEIPFTNMYLSWFTVLYNVYEVLLNGSQEYIALMDDIENLKGAGLSKNGQRSNNQSVYVSNGPAFPQVID